MQYVEELAMETEDEEQSEMLFNELSYLTENPFELNSVTKEQLRKLPFLTDVQIDRIISYRTRYGKMMTIYELKNIEGLDFQTLQLLLPFVYVGEHTVEKRSFTVNNLLKYGRNELLFRYDRCLQQKKGYRLQPDSVLEKYPNRQYLGEPFYHSLRYSYTFDDRLQVGFVGEKDAGEPFWNEYHKGYDFYSFHFILKDIKWLKTLAVGDYKISFGQGLVISNDFTPGRNAMVAQAERRNNGFRRHYSTNESDFFRGAAATVTWDKVDFSFFYSYKKADAVPIDSNRISSVKTDGLHRVEKDRERKRILPIQTFGGNVRYAVPDLSLGLTAVSYSFGTYELQPDLKPYNRFYFRGNKNTNISVDYMWKNRYIKFYGETALSENKAIASLNALQITPVSYITALILYRYYDRKYQSFYGNAFGQHSTVQNEQGLYAGIQFTPFPYWKLSAYADFFRFPWLKYGVDAPSTGYEYMIQVDCNKIENVSIYLRYKFKQKEKNGRIHNQPDISILPYTQNRLRFQVRYNIRHANFQTSVDANIYDEKENRQSRGVMLSQSVGWKSPGLPVQFDIYSAVFHTDNYYSRLSSYEKNILYAFNMPQFYGKGVRFSTTLRWDIVERLSLSAKLAFTRYSDRETIGTDLEEIEGNTKTDVYALLRWKF